MCTDHNNSFHVPKANLHCTVAVGFVYKTSVLVNKSYKLQFTKCKSGLFSSRNGDLFMAIYCCRWDPPLNYLALTSLHFNEFGWKYGFLL